VPRGNQDLVLHQVAAGDHLGNRMFHLDPRVHLDEVVVPFVIDQKLDRARIAVLDLPGNLQSGGAELFPLGLGQAEGGGELHHLLVTALHRAVAVEEVDQVAVVVPQHLHLDVLGVLDIALQEDRRITEGCLGFAAGGNKPLQQLLLVPGHAHAPAAATCRGLDDDGVAILLGKFEGLLFLLDRVLGTGHHLHPGGNGRLAAGHLVPQRPLHLGRRADEDNAGSLALFGKLGVFRQETVAGMNCVHIRLQRQGDDLVNPQIGVDGGLSLADQVRLVRLVAVQGELVLLRIDCHRADTQLGAGAENADGNLAAVGSHYLSEASFFHYCLHVSCKIKQLNPG